LTTTETIAKEMKRMGLDTFINRNVLNSEIIKISTNLPKNVEKDDTINIGYFSGSKTHDGDFSLVKKVLLKILAKYDNARIITAGYINLDKEFEKFKERIIVLPFVNWRELPLNIQKADINIVPLRDCIFNHAKSELKYLEAGILKIPTIASATTPYEFAIKDGFNGFIAKDEKEWTEKLENLIDNKDLRKKIGENAYNHIHNNYTTQARESQFTKYILDIVEANKKK
jgi:glycosyltransferase involved in cell wall biosynthesis